MRIIQGALIVLTLIFGGACHRKKVDQEQSRRLDSVEKRLLTLEQRAAEISKLSERTVEIQYEIDALENEIEYLKDIAEDLQSQIDDLSVVDGDLGLRLSQIDSSITILETSVEKGIAELIDPCGASGGYDEILLKLNDGTIVAYFESGSNRHLSTLEPGNYRTSDASRCFFTVDSSNSVVNQHY